MSKGCEEFWGQCAAILQASELTQLTALLSWICRSCTRGMLKSWGREYFVFVLDPSRGNKHLLSVMSDVRRGGGLFV